ncbi:MAG: TonB family protein, partial [Ignavibacteriales bacterium]|nr:TonB family protein [Ignavibacteriales bacterium]
MQRAIYLPTLFLALVPFLLGCEGDKQTANGDAVVDYDDPPTLLNDAGEATKTLERSAKVTAKDYANFAALAKVSAEGEIEEATIIRAERVENIDEAKAFVETLRAKPAERAGEPVPAYIVVSAAKKSAEVWSVEPAEIDKSANDVFEAVDHMPMPVGGMAAIQSKIVYPASAKNAGVQGKVFVEATIDEKGDVISVFVLKGIGAGCDEAAAKAVRETKFTPGKNDGEP